MAGYCKVCLRPLEVAQYSVDGTFKSCPNCSTNNGQEHIFYHCDYFGYTDHRITGNNPDGIQSWCPPCRGRGSSIGNGIKCNTIKIK